jgi:hypothetical protein
MSFFGFAKAKISTPTIGLPVSRDVIITAHVWPADRPNCKDLRIAFHSKHQSTMESDVVYKFLKVYGNDTEVNETTGSIKTIIENPLIPFCKRKFDELGLNVKWINIKP